MIQIEKKIFLIEHFDPIVLKMSDSFFLFV